MRGQIKEIVRGLPISENAKYPISLRVDDPITLDSDFVARLQKPEVVAVSLDKPNFSAEMLRSESRVFEQMVLHFAERAIFKVIDSIVEISDGSPEIDRIPHFSYYNDKVREKIASTLIEGLKNAKGKNDRNDTLLFFALITRLAYADKLLEHGRRTRELLKAVYSINGHEVDRTIRVIDVIIQNSAEYVPLLGAMQSAEVKYSAHMPLVSLFEDNHVSNLRLLTPNGMPNGNPVPVARR